MLKPILMGILLTTVPAPVLAQQCLHGPNETAAERARRQQAIQVARQINALEAATLDPGAQAPRYKRPSELKYATSPEPEVATVIPLARKQ